LKNKKLQKILILVSKIVITILAWWYIYDKIIASSDEFEFISFTKDIWTSLFFVILLVFVNWAIEAKKWQMLVNKITEISFLKSLQGTLIGVSIGFITPNRIGDIGGRSVVLKEHKKKGMVATTIGSMLQFLVTIVMGLLGLLLLFLFFSLTPIFKTLLLISFLTILFVVTIIIVSQGKNWLRKVVLKIIGTIKYKKLILTLRLFTRKIIVKAFLLASLRYIVFSCQYIILLQLFVPDITIFESVIGIFLTYLFVTIIPSSILGELGVRGSVSVFVFTLFTVDASPIFQVSLLMWLVNLAFPVVIGSVLLLLHKNKR